MRRLKMLNKIKELIIKLFKLGKSFTRDELLSFGARVGENFYNCGIIDRGHAHLLTIGDNVTLSSCRILLHDASTKLALDHSRIGRVEIGDNVFVGAGVIILPNVKIGSNVVIGAGSVVIRDIPDNCVAVGNPCKPVKPYDQFIEENKKLMETSPVYYIPFDEKTKADKKDQFDKLKDGGIGFDY